MVAVKILDDAEIIGEFSQKFVDIGTRLNTLEKYGIYTSLTDLKNAKVGNFPYILLTANSKLEYVYKAGDFTGKADDVSVIQLVGTALTTGALVLQLEDGAVNLRAFGADPTGLTSSSGALRKAVAVSKRVIGSPGDIYLIDSQVEIPEQCELFGNGATLKIAPSIIGAILLNHNYSKVSGWKIIGQGGGFAVLNQGKFNSFVGNVCTGNIGHYFFSINAEHVLATQNQFDGLTADTQINSAIVTQSCRHITISNNQFKNITVGWGVEIRNGSEDFTIHGNNFYQQQYFDEKTATQGQTDFTFTLEQACFLRKIQIEGKPLSKGYTVTPTGRTYAVKFTAGRTGGEKIRLVGYRGAENIQINTGSRYGTVSSNTIDGTADSGIIAYGSNISITNNTIRNTGYAGIAIYGDQDGIAVIGNTLIDCAQMDDGLSSPDFPDLSSPFAGAIITSGSAATVIGNIIRNPGGTMRYAVMINKTDMTVRPDGTPTINIEGNICDGIYVDGKISAPNQTFGQRVNSVSVDGTPMMYPKQIDLDSPWVEPSGRVGFPQPADNGYFTIKGSANTRAVYDTNVKLGGIASLQTVPGEYIDFEMTACAMLFNSVVKISFWAKSNGGSSLLELISTLDGLEQPIGVSVSEQEWKRYAFSVAFTPNLEKKLRIRCSASPGSSANFQYIQISANRL